MWDKSVDNSLYDRVQQINEHDAPRISSFVDRYSSDAAAPILQAISEFHTQLELLGRGGDAGGPLNDTPTGLPIGEPDFHERGAQAFVQVLTEHPVFSEDRQLEVGLPIFGLADDHDDKGNDQALFDLRRDAADLLVAGALAIGSVGAVGDLRAPIERYSEALIQIAAGADTFGRVLKDVLLGKPVPGIRDLPDIPTELLKWVEYLVRRNCGHGVIQAVHAMNGATSGSSATSWSTGISSLTPNHGCAGTAVTIAGSGFGQIRPADVGVWFPGGGSRCTPAKVVQSWSDSQIVVEAPDDVGRGCVGFVSISGAGLGGVAEAAAALAGEMVECFGAAAMGAAQKLGKFGTAPLPLSVPCPPCLPLDVNLFRGGHPTNVTLLVNGVTDLTVAPNTPLTFSWSATNATEVIVRRTSAEGPAFNLVNPPSNTFTIQFTGAKQIDATFEIVAKNACEVVVRQVTVRLRQDPKLSITGIEVVQSIQRADNSVRLVAGKRTIVRVYVDSGIRNDFDSGWGRNVYGNIRGEVTIRAAGSSGPGTSIGPIVNLSGTIALPAPDRNIASSSLNFELPLSQLMGTIEIEARVFVAGHEIDRSGPWTASRRTTVNFQQQPTQEVLPLLVLDNIRRNLGRPTLAQFHSTLEGARTRFPIAQDGFIINPPISIHCLHDLATDVGWAALVFDVTTLIFLFPTTPVGGIRVALVPNFRGYQWNGQATPRVGVTVPAFAARAGKQATFAHEVGHAFGLGHALCPPAGQPGSPGPPIDTYRPIEAGEPSFEVSARGFRDSRASEIMSYCPVSNRESRWPSIVTYDEIFDRLPI